MKRFFVILLIVLIGSSVLAEIPTGRVGNVQANRINKMPKGTFKKARNGKIIQYNNKGKKIGVYKLDNGSLVRVK